MYIRVEVEYTYLLRCGGSTLGLGKGLGEESIFYGMLNEGVSDDTRLQDNG